MKNNNKSSQEVTQIDYEKCWKATCKEAVEWCSLYKKEKIKSSKAISNFAEKMKKLIQEYGIQGKIHITPNKINEEIDKLVEEQSSGERK